jgi:hypothetical protein
MVKLRLLKKVNYPLNLFNVLISHAIDEKTDMSLIPPLIEDVERELAAKNSLDQQETSLFGSNSRKSRKNIHEKEKGEKTSKDAPSPSSSRQNLTPNVSKEITLPSPKEVEKEPPKEEYVSTFFFFFTE